MTEFDVTQALAFAAMAGVALIVVFWLARRHRRLRQRLSGFRQEVVEVSADASVGRRLAADGDSEFAPLAGTINRLFDTLGEREEAIQDRDRLFADFARTLPEIVVVHDERILLANEKASALVGLAPEQLIGRDAADLVKPAYRALFRKTIAKHIEGDSAPRPLEIQLIDGNEQGLWVEAQSSAIEYRGAPAILTIARDLSYRKSLEVSLSRSRRQAQYTLESISEA